MGFLSCPNCGNLNRDSDANCFNCQGDLTAVPPPPPPVVETPVVQEAEPERPVMRIGTDSPDKPRFKDLASRYETKPVPKMDSSITHGLRAGIAGGIIVGLLQGALRMKVPDDVTRLIIRAYPKTPKDGIDIFLFSFLGDVLFGVVLGMILGFINILCWTAESSRTGAIIGLIIALLVYYKVGLGAAPMGIFLGAVHGYLLGFAISVSERKLFRRI